MRLGVGDELVPILDFSLPGGGVLEDPAIMVYRIWGYRAVIKAMNYRGYLARVEFDSRDNIFVGHVLGVSDRISLHGETVAELTGISTKPSITILTIVQRPAAGKSISQWADEVLERASHA
jgi:hypothetical protein